MVPVPGGGSGPPLCNLHMIAHNRRKGKGSAEKIPLFCFSRVWGRISYCLNPGGYAMIAWKGKNTLGYFA